MSNTYALITGSSKGIGKSIATQLAAKGYSLLLVARSGNLLEDMAKDLGSKYNVDVKWLALDLGITGAAQQIYDWCKGNDYTIGILVNNAGYGLSGKFDKYSPAEYQAMMNINMHVPVSLCLLFMDQLKHQPNGYILNISSSTAYQAIPGLAVYAASKSFLLSFSRALRKEIKNTTVSITCICPGATDTNFVNQANIGTKARKMAEKVNMTADKVAAIAINAMFHKKPEVIPGFINKVGATLTWLMPKSIMENGALKIYEP